MRPYSIHRCSSPGWGDLRPIFDVDGNGDADG
jgi:hypothetical protein